MSAGARTLFLSWPFAQTSDQGPGRFQHRHKRPTEGHDQSPSFPAPHRMSLRFGRRSPCRDQAVPIHDSHLQGRSKLELGQLLQRAFDLEDFVSDKNNRGYNRLRGATLVADLAGRPRRFTPKDFVSGCGLARPGAGFLGCFVECFWPRRGRSNGGFHCKCPLN